MIPQGVEVYEINGPYFFGIATKFEEIMSRLDAAPVYKLIGRFAIRVCASD